MCDKYNTGPNLSGNVIRRYLSKLGVDVDISEGERDSGCWYYVYIYIYMNGMGLRTSPHLRAAWYTVSGEILT